MHPAWQEMVEQSGYASNSKVMLGEVSVEQGIEEMLGILDRYMEENHDRFSGAQELGGGASRIRSLRSDRCTEAPNRTPPASPSSGVGRCALDGG